MPCPQSISSPPGAVACATSAAARRRAPHTRAQGRSFPPVALLLLGVLLLGALALGGCSPGEPSRGEDGQPTRGRVLLWHMWNESDATLLNQLLERFHQVYPEITVISIAFSPEELQEQFALTVDRGLGPDLIIAPHLWTQDLADPDLIEAVDEDTVDLGIFNPDAVETLRYQEQLFGVPLALQTAALYYNRNLVDEPPATLDAVLERAADGYGIAIDTNFEAAFWGVQAFGGRLLDGEERVVLNQGGFANWMEWLREANSVPNVLLDNDVDVLRELFVSGQVAYYVGSSSELSNIRASLGQDAIGVAPLPAGPNDAAGPFLTTEAFFFSTASSPAQAERARLLVQFLTNPEQQRKLARDTGRIPANAQVRIDRRITPAVASFVEQSKTAVPLRLSPPIFETINRGRDTYVQVLEGLTSPAEAALALTEAVNESQGMETLALVTEVSCESVGTVEVWHSWPESQTPALEEVAAAYHQLCPGLSVVYRSFLPSELFANYRKAVVEGGGPDLLLTSSDQTAQLVQADLIQDISDSLSPEFQQRYIPAAPDTVRVGSRLYGLPIALDTFALYFNAYLVSEAPVDLSDLLAQIGSDRALVAPSTPFEALHWGASAFGGRVFDAGGALVLNDPGAVEWLEWLHAAQSASGVSFVRSQEEAVDQFVAGEAVYLTGGPRLLPDLQQRMGRAGVGVAPLPSGPEGPSGPILKTHALMLNPKAGNPKAAVEFARYVTGAESQRTLMEMAQAVPANNTLTLDEMTPAIGAFVAQAATAIALPNLPEAGAVLGLGSLIYDKVLQQDAPPAAILNDFTTFIKREYASAESVEVCDQEAEVVLWHSLQSKAESTLVQIVDDFARVCPGIDVQTLYVDWEALPTQLALAIQADGAEAVDAQTDPGAEAGAEAGTEAESLPVPDFFLTSHDLIEPLSAERLIQPVTEYIDGSALIPFLPEALAPFQADDALYGLPFSLETTALYYDSQQMDAPPTALYDLFATVTVSAPLALDSSFREAFWGALAFGGDGAAVQAIPGAGENIGLHLEQTSLVNWLRWLHTTQTRPGFFLTSDANRLKELFVTGNASYLIGSTTLLPQLRAEMEADSAPGARIGVSVLPAGPSGPVTPFLTVEGFLFTADRPESRRRAAARFAAFATSGPEQALLLRDADRLTANIMAQTLVEDPAVPKLIAQLDHSVPTPPLPQARVLFEGGDIFYRGVLEEDAAPTVALRELQAYLAETPLPAVVLRAGETVVICSGGGRLRLWHSWPGLDEAPTGDQAEDALSPWEQVLANFQQICPDTTVDARFVPADEMTDALADALAQEQPEDALPTLFLVQHHQIPGLVAAELVTPVNDLVFEQDAYASHLLDPFRYEDNLYALPQFVDLVGLYYNTDLVSTTVTSLDDLLVSASPERAVLLPTGFDDLYWGISAFGPSLLDGQGGLADVDGLEAWLGWLASAQKEPGIVMRGDAQALERRFAAGDGAYLLAHPQAWPRLRAAMGESVRVIPLPAGPNGDSAPLLAVEGFAFSRSVEPELLQQASAFVRFLADGAALTLLNRSVYLPPANRRAAEAIDDPALTLFATQAWEQGVVLPASLTADRRDALAGAFRSVLAGENTPAQAIVTLQAAFAE